MKVPIGTATPAVDDTAWVAPNATLVGDVVVQERASVFYGAVLRGDRALIDVGAEANVQDLVVVHGDVDSPTLIGEGVSVGHAAVLHGCRIGARSLIGMGSIVMAGVDVGEGCLVAAGSLLLEGFVVPPHTLVAGSPGTVRRDLRQDESAQLARNAKLYLDIVADHLDGLNGSAW